MKKARNLLANRLLQTKRDTAKKKVKSLEHSSSYEETLKELREVLGHTETENKKLQITFWAEIRNNVSLQSTKDKVQEGWSPNDLECEKIGILRI